MATIEVIIRDDEGNIVSKNGPKKYRLNLSKSTLAEIEGAVDSFKNKALPEIEEELLSAAQARFVEEQKKEETTTETEKHQ
jgi:hypothetical protein